MHQSPFTAAALTAGAASAAASETKVLDFAARLDARLANLDPAEREPFLSNLLISWTARYGRFLDRAQSGEEDIGEMDAFDYASCIAEINVRQGRLAQ
jgi:hypothetical protein